MHEILLFGQVPRARHEQVLKILAGVAAMQPHRILERHAVYKPQREPEEPGSHLRRGGSQNVSAAHKTKQAATPKDLYYCQTVEKLSEDEFGSSDSLSSAARATHTARREADAESKYSLRFNHVPDANDTYVKKGVLVRLTHRTDILQGQPHAYMNDLGYQFVSEYFQDGHRFVHENVVILLHRILQVPGVRNVETAPMQTLPPFATLQPLDPSGSYILQATVRVQDGSNSAVMDAAIDEIMGFKDQMTGCVALVMPERLDLDTRVKYKPPHQVQPAQRPAQVDDDEEGDPKNERESDLVLDEFTTLA